MEITKTFKTIITETVDIDDVVIRAAAKDLISSHFTDYSHRDMLIDIITLAAEWDVVEDPDKVEDFVDNLTQAERDYLINRLFDFYKQMREKKVHDDCISLFGHA